MASKTHNNYLWDNDDFLELSPQERDLYWYLLDKNANIYGVFKSVRSALLTLGTNKSCIDSLVNANFLLKVNDCYVIRDYWKHNTITQNFKKSADKYNDPYINVTSILKLDENNLYSLDNGVLLEEHIYNVLGDNKSHARENDKGKDVLLGDMFKLELLALCPIDTEKNSQQIKKAVDQYGEPIVRQAWSITAHSMDTKKKTAKYITATAKGISENGAIMQQNDVPIITHEMCYPTYDDNERPKIPPVLNPLQQLYANTFGSGALEQAILEKKL